MSTEPAWPRAFSAYHLRPSERATFRLFIGGRRFGPERISLTLTDDKMKIRALGHRLARRSDYQVIQLAMEAKLGELRQLTRNMLADFDRLLSADGLIQPYLLHYENYQRSLMVGFACRDRIMRHVHHFFVELNDIGEYRSDWYRKPWPPQENMFGSANAYDRAMLRWQARFSEAATEAFMERARPILAETQRRIKLVLPPDKEIAV